MPYTEAKEHVNGRLHALFADPYRAFENAANERQLHLRLMLYVLAVRPMAQGLLTLRVIHGWENGGCEPEGLQHVDYAIDDLDALRAASSEFAEAYRLKRDFPSEQSAILADPLADAIAEAKAEGAALTIETLAIPARWPTFQGGLALYTLFKMYHRLIYGEDDAYRCSLCLTPHGEREIHEFHLEEGEFALLTPTVAASSDAPTLLVLHESQLEPLTMLLEESTALLATF